VTPLEFLDTLEVLSAGDGLLDLPNGACLLFLELFQAVFHETALELNFFVFQGRQEHVLAHVTLSARDHRGCQDVLLVCGSRQG
jgi:hypothetical protein